MPATSRVTPCGVNISTGYPERSQLPIPPLARSSKETAMKNLAIIALGSAACLGTFSNAMAADAVRPVVVAPAPVLAPVLVHPHHPLLGPVLWCVGGVIISVAIHNAIPAGIGCTVGAVKAVHAHAYGAYGAYGPYGARIY